MKKNFLYNSRNNETRSVGMKKTAIKLVGIILVLIMAVLPSLNAFALSGDLDPDIIAETSQTAIDIEGEGIVLLKNEENLLPLNGKKLNIFGAGSVCPFYGGSGSGSVVSENPTSFYDALDAEGVEYNKNLRELYEDKCGSNETIKTDNTVVNNLLALILAKSSLKEMPEKYLTDELMASAKAYSDTALIMISRTSAEGTDLTHDILCLNEDEKALVEKVDSTFDDVIVLFNIANVMEMGWIDEYESIKAAAIIWIPGEFGMTAVARMLKGQINPSGRLADTVAYCVDDHPSSECFGSHKYNGGGYYVEYLEGIYVGYRYFETFAKDKVQFPFGYGLSYTEFEKSVVSTEFNSDTISVEVNVTNTGSAAGKETVQLYYSAPYYEGGIEKSAICLGGYAKTDIIQPGESQVITVSFDTDDMASYDHKKNEAWILEAGTYKIILGENAREHIAVYDYTVSEDKIMKYDDVTGTEIQNRFDDVYSGFPVLSRADAQGTYPEFRQLSATEEIKNVDNLPEPETQGEAPKTGVEYDQVITLHDVYEDESLWDAFLDQLTVNEMAMLVIDGGYGTRGIERLGIPQTWDNDGPSSVKGQNGLCYVDSGTAYPCETALACTWNVELALEMGRGAGKEARDMGTDIWYAPGVNIHRNPAGGRNFEYFSEDPVLSGKMAAAIINGCNEEGLVVTIKHFVLNDQESHREGIFTWANEQTMREIYLKAFEIPVKEADCKGVMSAFNRLGVNWCGGSSALLKDVLRSEWGFEGFVVSDYSWNFTGSGYMSPVIAVYNGNDTILSGIWAVNLPSHITAVTAAYYRDPIGFGSALREASKNLCIAKMHTKAFLEPYEYDGSFIGALDLPSEWEFESPYVFSVIRFIFNNFLNVIIFVVRHIL